MATVTVDMRDLDQLRRDLNDFAKKAAPFAQKFALNDTAEVGRLIWRSEMKEAFVLRNKFTQNSLMVVRVKGTNPDKMFSVLGSISPYMGLQELGGTSSGKSGSKPIPTSVAAGQAMGSRPRTRVVRRPNRMPNINLDRQATGGSKRQRNAINVRQAAARKRRFALITMQSGKKGIVRVTGRKKLTVRLIWDLSRRTVRVPRNPTLQRSVRRLGPLMPAIQRKAIIDQLRFRRILGF